MIDIMLALSAVHPLLLIVTVPLAGIVAWYVYRKAPSFTMHSGLGEHYRCTPELIAKKPLLILYGIRFAILTILALLITQPQFLNSRRRLNVEGVPIMVVLDISMSMHCFDDIDDQRTRIEVARAQARRFIARRTNDPIGLVFFANGALSRCPITLDKKMLDSLCKDVQIGDLDAEGTKLSLGLLMAVRRLMESKAPEKVIILLTDGAPSANDISPEPVIELLKAHHIKVYTIGVGNINGGYIMHPMWGLQVVPAQIDTPLLERYASETGGRYFRAERPTELASIYDTIDRLERSSFETPLYEHWTDIGSWFLIPLFLLFCIEICTRFYWRIIV